MDHSLQHMKALKVINDNVLFMCRKSTLCYMIPVRHIKVTIKKKKTKKKKTSIHNAFSITFLLKDILKAESYTL